MTARRQHSLDATEPRDHKEGAKVSIFEIRHSNVKAIAMACALLLVAGGTTAHADTASDLASSEETLEAKRAELAATQEDMSRLQAEIDAKAIEIQQKQESYRTVATDLSYAIRTSYKSTNLGVPSALQAIMDSDSIDELMTRFQYAEAVTVHLTGLTKNAKDLSEDLRRQYEEISSQKDECNRMAEALSGDVASLETEVSELEDRLSQERARSFASSAKERTEGATTSTFSTGSTDGWRTGVASAYGGWSDPSTGAVCSTATGAVCDDWSMGVAVPMAWSDYRSYFNRTIEISYNGQSVIATVNDCGYMGAGSRSLDLQPGVFKAFGFSTCDDWGLRTVSYRFL